ncbi:unnamed protein product [Ostreobium quekettii]|uniref:t-SNARE coiled-coil homology domain-containing protein n=1 Tax=Ostreobium quekettii TaxID=121088 RepID=A0A8S1IL90_9CHLO|nr:unnamed protein product [Ostreobium quekettii]|eukprot:evm.model.scf_57.13 EVM.evm.TU.scf_57.13   scf_57:102638-105571(+)
MTAAARRKLGSLSTAIDGLEEALNSAGRVELTENERNRRRDLVMSLRSQRENLLQALKRESSRMDRNELMGGSSGGPARETEQTAGLDNAGLLQLQNQIIDQQDKELDQIEESVKGTKHVAIAMGEELDLQAHLLDDLEEEVGVVHSRLGVVTSKIKTIMRQSGECKWWCMVVGLLVVLIILLVILFNTAWK